MAPITWHAHGRLTGRDAHVGKMLCDMREITFYRRGADGDEPFGDLRLSGVEGVQVGVGFPLLQEIAVGGPQCALMPRRRHRGIACPGRSLRPHKKGGRVDVALGRLGKKNGPFQGNLRSMRFLTTSQGCALAASCS